MNTNAGIIYAFINQAIPNTVYLGYTQGGLEPCIMALEGDNIPFPYEYGFVLYSQSVAHDYVTLTLSLEGTHLKDRFYAGTLADVQMHAIEAIRS